MGREERRRYPLSLDRWSLRSLLVASWRFLVSLHQMLPHLILHHLPSLFFRPKTWNSNNTKNSYNLCISSTPALHYNDKENCQDDKRGVFLEIVSGKRFVRESGCIFFFFFVQLGSNLWHALNIELFVWHCTVFDTLPILTRDYI